MSLPSLPHHHPLRSPSFRKWSLNPWRRNSALSREAAGRKKKDLWGSLIIPVTLLFLAAQADIDKRNGGGDTA